MAFDLDVFGLPFLPPIKYQEGSLVFLPNQSGIAYYAKELTDKDITNVQAAVEAKRLQPIAIIKYFPGANGMPPSIVPTLLPGVVTNELASIPKLTNVLNSVLKKYGFRQLVPFLSSEQILDLATVTLVRTGKITKLTEEGARELAATFLSQQETGDALTALKSIGYNVKALKPSVLNDRVDKSHLEDDEIPASSQTVDIDASSGEAEVETDEVDESIEIPA